MRDGDSEDIPLTEDIKNDPLFCAKGRFITHKRLPGKFSTITKWRVVYKELVAQYQKFREVTKGKADYSHVDFHLWFNLTWPVSVALNIFTWKYGIKSVRYLGQHQVNSLRYKVYRALSWNPCVKSYPRNKYRLLRFEKGAFDNCKTIELYCHPHYKDGVFLDDSPSYLKHERLPVNTQIQNLKDIGDVKVISWADLTSQSK